MQQATLLPDPTGPLMPRMFFVLLWNAAHVGLALYVIVLTAMARAPSFTNLHRLTHRHAPQVLPPREVQPHPNPRTHHPGARPVTPNPAPLASLAALPTSQHKPADIAATARLAIKPPSTPPKPPRHAPRALLEAHHAYHNGHAPRRRSDTANVVPNRKLRKWHGITTHIRPPKTQYAAKRKQKKL
jgi:hypothetical protein